MSTGRFLDPASIEGAPVDGETIATASGIPTWLPGSVPVIWLPAGSTAANVPAGTPAHAIILISAV